MPTDIKIKASKFSILAILGAVLSGLFTSLFVSGLLALGILLIIPIMVLRGWAIVKLWDWFGAPLFPSLWHPTVYSAVGLVFVVAMIWPYKLDHAKEKEKTKQIGNLVFAVFFPVFTVLVAWVWRWVML